MTEQELRKMWLEYTFGWDYELNGIPPTFDEFKNGLD